MSLFEMMGGKCWRQGVDFLGAFTLSSAFLRPITMTVPRHAAFVLAHEARQLFFSVST
jgi:hypothetical protein